MPLIKTEVVIGEGSTQVLCEKAFSLKWPLKKVVHEIFDVEITNCEVCTDKVIFNGLVQKNLIYKTPADPPPNTEGQSSLCCCTSVSSQDGFIVFHEEVLGFAGFVEIPGAQPGDNYQVEIAEVSDCTKFHPEVDPDGLIRHGKQKFIIDVTIKVTRTEQIDVEEVG